MSLPRQLPRGPRGKTLGLLATIGVGGMLVGAVTAGADTGSPWNWLTGDERAYVGGSSQADNLELHAVRDVNITAGHVRIVGTDGNFEFEHAKNVATTRLNAYVLGSSARTPVTIGGVDAQNIVPLIVEGSSTQKSDLQQWTASGKTVAAVTPSGGLSLNGISLSMSVVDGRVQLVATLPDGTRQVLATGTATASAAAKRPVAGSTLSAKRNAATQTK